MMYIIICVLLVINIGLETAKYFIDKKHNKKVQNQIENLALKIHELENEVDLIQHSKERFEKTSERVSKEYRFIVNELNKTNEAITIMNNGFTIAGAK